MEFFLHNLFEFQAAGRSDNHFFNDFGRVNSFIFRFFFIQIFCFG